VAKDNVFCHIPPYKSKSCTFYSISSYSNSHQDLIDSSGTSSASTSSNPEI